MRMLNFSNLLNTSLKLCLLLSPLVILQTKQIERDTTPASNHSLHHRPELFNETCQDTAKDLTKCSRHTQSILKGGSLTGHRWYMGYFDEQTDGFELRVFEQSLDERLSNIIHLVNSQKCIDSDFFAYNSGDHELDLKVIQAVAGPQVDELKCNGHLRQMVALMSEMSEQLVEKRTNSSKRLQFDERHLRFARVLESFGRYEPGFLSGRTQSTGQFDQCVSSHLLLADDGQEQRVGSRYCWTKLDAAKHLHPSLKQRQRSEYESANDRISVGVCLPKSCHTKTFHAGKLAKENRELVQKLVDSQFKLPGALYIEKSLRVDSIFCLVDPDSEQAKMPASGKLALGFLFGWLVLAFYATNYYTAPKIEEANKDNFFVTLMDCLNMRKSIKDFLCYEHKQVTATNVKMISSRDQRVDLSAMDAVKVLCCLFVVMGHSLVIHSIANQNSVKFYHVTMTDPIVLLMVMGTSVVDTFFVMTGLLMGYIQMARDKRHKSTAIGNGLANATPSAKSASSPAAGGGNRIKSLVFYWLKFAAKRHLSLVPMLFLVFWFKKAVLINWFPQWPMWDAGFNRNTAHGACRQESWLSPITLTAALVPINRQCLPQTWSVATDLFFSLTIPPVLFLLSRKPRWALALGSLMAVLSNLWTRQAYDKVDPILKESLENVTTEGFLKMFGTIHHLYTYPHFRLSSVLIGVLAGYCLFKYNESDKSSEWPKWFRQIATRGVLMAAFQITLIFSCVHYLKPYVHPHQALVMANLFTWFRIVIATCNAVIMMRIVTDWRQSFVMRLFVGRFWRSMTKLNYAILLIHVDVIVFFVSGTSDSTYFSKHKILADFGSAYLYCLPLAMFLHVVYENPLNKFVKQHLEPKVERLLN